MIDTRIPDDIFDIVKKKFDDGLQENCMASGYIRLHRNSAYGHPIHWKKLYVFVECSLTSQNLIIVGKLTEQAELQASKLMKESNDEELKNIADNSIQNLLK